MQVLALKRVKHPCIRALCRRVRYASCTPSPQALVPSIVFHGRDQLVRTATTTAAHQIPRVYVGGFCSLHRCFSGWQPR